MKSRYRQFFYLLFNSMQDVKSHVKNMFKYKNVALKGRDKLNSSFNSRTTDINWLGLCLISKHPLICCSLTFILRVNVKFMYCFFDKSTFKKSNV